MMRVSMLTLAAITAITPLYAFGQATAAPTSASAKALPSTGAVAQTPGLSLRSLPAVLDARERRQDWHAAAEQAGSRIQDPGLKSQFNQRMAGLVPAVAKLLIAHPQDYALVTVGVYRGNDAPDRQAMLAVTFEGLDTQLGSSFFADVVSGLPQAPSGEGLPAGLKLDTEATSYLVFFLGEKQLEAGDIPHTTFGKSIMLATNRAQKDADAQALATANVDRARIASQERAQAGAAQRNGQQPTNTNTGSATNGYNDGQAAGYVAQASPYGNGYGYNYPLVNDGYYYPGIGVPIVILPGEAQTTPQIQQQQVEREKRLERDYQRRAGGGGRVTGIGQPPAMGTGTHIVNGVQSAPPTGTGSNNVTGVGSAPASGAPGSNSAAAGGTGPTQGATTPRTFPQPGQAGGAPAGSNVPASPAPSSNGGASSSGGSGSSGGAPRPAAGAPGGAPAGKK